MQLDNEPVMLAFLKHEDAIHWAQLLKNYGRHYANMQLGITQDFLRGVGIGSISANTPFVVLDSEDARQYLTDYPGMLDSY